MEDLKNEERTVAHTIWLKPSVNKGLTLELLDENEGVKRTGRKSIATKIAEAMEERHERIHGRPKRAGAKKKRATPAKSKR